jgi:hypothetical protein
MAAQLAASQEGLSSMELVSWLFMREGLKKGNLCLTLLYIV